MEDNLTRKDYELLIQRVKRVMEHYSLKIYKISKMSDVHHSTVRTLLLGAIIAPRCFYMIDKAIQPLENKLFQEELSK